MSIERLSMLSRVRTVLVALATVATVALSLTAALPSSAQAATGAKPKVGQCHQLSWAQAGARSDSKRPVDCHRRHNLQTVAVVTSTASLEGMADEDVSDLGARLCNGPVNRALGRTQVLRSQSAYTFSYFRPTPAQIAAGANWFRCDVAKLQENRYAQLHGRLKRPILSKHLADSERLCLTRRGWGTTCTQPHAWRTTKGFALHLNHYPTASDVVPIARRKCPKGWDYVRWSSEWAWSVGEHVATCYDKTRK
jgi:hypothetical protein